MKYTFYILSCLQTIHPKKCIRIFLRRRLPDVLLAKIRSDPSETLKTTHFNASNGNLHPQHFSSKHPSYAAIINALIESDGLSHRH